MEKTQITSNLPHELRVNYRVNRKNSPLIEQLKVVAALKLWEHRGFRDAQFEVPLSFGGQRVFVKVLARNEDGVVAVECCSKLMLGWLRGRVALLRGCLPADTYLVVVFPSGVGERVDVTAGLADEVWVTNKDNSKVERMMFMSVCHRE
ncbi:MAG: hypothetical protein NWF01_05725 [Candidatus Bathyarchaeota archaeon]|nr:hypothetical protein [Candidatus Bathyarchaeota archaeon]